MYESVAGGWRPTGWHSSSCRIAACADSSSHNEQKAVAPQAARLNLLRVTWLMSILPVGAISIVYDCDMNASS